MFTLCKALQCLHNSELWKKVWWTEWQMDQTQMRCIHWTQAKSSVRGVKPNRECFLASSSLCLPPQSPLFPSLFIASPPLIFLHRSFSALLSCSFPLFAEVMTELPWHMLRGWTSRASKHTPTLMHSHTENICWMNYCRVTIPTRANEMVMENKVCSQTNGLQNLFFGPLKIRCNPLIGQKIFVNNQWSMHSPGGIDPVFDGVLCYFAICFLLIRYVLLFIARSDQPISVNSAWPRLLQTRVKDFSTTKDAWRESVMQKQQFWWTSRQRNSTLSDECCKRIVYHHRTK